MSSKLVGRVGYGLQVHQLFTFEIHLHTIEVKTDNKTSFDIVLGDDVSGRTLHRSLDDLDALVNSWISLCLGKCSIPFYFPLKSTSGKVNNSLPLKQYGSVKIVGEQLMSTHVTSYCSHFYIPLGINLPDRSLLSKKRSLNSNPHKILNTEPIFKL